MTRRIFVNRAFLASGLGIMNPTGLYPNLRRSSKDFPVVRIPESDRNFVSAAVEGAISDFTRNVGDPELAWLFNNCFPNTLDTTVDFNGQSDRPDTYVITGDIDAMWLRDSSAQVWPYLQFVSKDDHLKKLIAGVINRQTQYLLKDPYANAFYQDSDKKGEWFSDHTDMTPGVHERKYEIDSLCYPIRLGYHYWKATADIAPFDASWQEAIGKVLQVFRAQQKKEGQGPYSFQRTTPHATDTRALKGYGYPVNPVGLICSAFRPSDDATVFSFLIPSNFFAVTSLRQAAEMTREITQDGPLADRLLALSDEVADALRQHATVEHKQYGEIYAFEVDGFGNHLAMDDANVPSLLSLPYLGAIDPNDTVYLNTRKFVWSPHNPFFFQGSAAEGIGGPHVGLDMVWPMSIIMYGLTADADDEIKHCIKVLKQTHAGTGFMHESFHKDDPANFSRSWFAWANTLFGELLYKTYQERPELLK